MKDRFDEAWEAFAAGDHARQAPGDLERRVLDALTPAFALPPSPSGLRRTGRATAGQAPAFALRAMARQAHYAAFALVASVVAAVLVLAPWRINPPEVVPLASRAFVPVPLQPALAAQPPRAPARIDVNREVALMDWIALYQDLPIILMLDAAESAAAESLQLVRLRMPKDALQALGIATLGPDVEGLVDVDLLVGEDGLPKTIRQIRLAQEE